MRNFSYWKQLTLVDFSECENMYIDISVINRNKNGKFVLYVIGLLIQYCTRWERAREEREIECKCVYRKTSTWIWVLTSKCCYIYRNIDTCVSNTNNTLDFLTLDQYLYDREETDKKEEDDSNWSDDPNMIMQLDSHPYVQIWVDTIGGKKRKKVRRCLPLTSHTWWKKLIQIRKYDVNIHTNNKVRLTTSNNTNSTYRIYLHTFN